MWLYLAFVTACFSIVGGIPLPEGEADDNTTVGQDILDYEWVEMILYENFISWQTTKRSEIGRMHIQNNVLCRRWIIRKAHF